MEFDDGFILQFGTLTPATQLIVCLLLLFRLLLAVALLADMLVVLVAIGSFVRGSTVWTECMPSMACTSQQLPGNNIECDSIIASTITTTADNNNNNNNNNTIQRCHGNIDERHDDGNTGSCWPVPCCRWIGQLQHDHGSG